MSKATEIVVESMKAEIRRAKEPNAFKPVHLCGKDCEDQKRHNDSAYLLAGQCQERYLETSQQRLGLYRATGVISSR